jgi:hypothetical protein
VHSLQLSSKSNVFVSGAVAGVIAVALIVVAIFIPGASILRAGSSTTAVQSSSQSGTVGVQLTDPPNVPPAVTSVYISYSEMAVHVADAGNYSGWYKVAPAGGIDLMSILNTSVTLGSSQVKSGIFNAVGFNITSATVTVNGANQTAFITNDKMIVPLVGGLQIQSGASEGILVDLSPTVIAVTNTSTTAYVLIPNAHALHIPASTWVRSSHVGQVIKNIQQQAWFREEARGNISLSNEVLSSDSLQITVTNKGQSNATISSLTVSYPLDVLCQQYSQSCMSAAMGGYAVLSRSIPVAQFAILSNGSLFQFNLTATAMSHNGDGQYHMAQSTTNALEGLQASGVELGYVLAPGQSVTLTFSGKIATISPDILKYIHLSVAIPNSLMSAVSSINSGQQYVLAVQGPFETFASAELTAK